MAFPFKMEKVPVFLRLIGPPGLIVDRISVTEKKTLKPVNRILPQVPKIEKTAESAILRGFTPSISVRKTTTLTNTINSTGAY